MDEERTWFSPGVEAIVTREFVFELASGETSELLHAEPKI